MKINFILFFCCLLCTLTCVAQKRFSDEQYDSLSEVMIDARNYDIGQCLSMRGSMDERYNLVLSLLNDGKYMLRISWSYHSTMCAEMGYHFLSVGRYKEDKKEMILWDRGGKYKLKLRKSNDTLYPVKMFANNYVLIKNKNNKLSYFEVTGVDFYKSDKRLMTYQRSIDGHIPGIYRGGEFLWYFDSTSFRFCYGKLDLVTGTWEVNRKRKLIVLHSKNLQTDFFLSMYMNDAIMTVKFLDEEKYPAVYSRYDSTKIGAQN